MKFVLLPRAPRDIEMFPDMPQLVSETRRLLAERGWAQRRWGDGQGRLCLFSAFTIALVGEPRRPTQPTGREGLAFARALGFENAEELIAWNDRSGTTYEEVLARLDQALARFGRPPATAATMPEPALIPNAFGILIPVTDPIQVGWVPS